MDAFTQEFRPFVCEGDTIPAPVSLAGWRTGLRLMATVYRDDCSDAPDERDDGFWPSLDPKVAGYIGPKSPSTLARHMRRAESVMQAWRDGEWFYCGIAVRAWFDDIPLTGEFDHALWGVDANYPQRDKRRSVNAYLREVANELAPECARAAIGRLTEMVESAELETA